MSFPRSAWKLVLATLLATTLPSLAAQQASLAPPCQTRSLPATIPAPGADGRYNGPLFESHLHFVSGAPATAEALCRYLDGNEEIGALVFLPPPASPGLVRYVEDARRRVIFLLHPFPFGEFAAGRRFAEGELRRYLQPNGLLPGVGEIALYVPEMADVGFGSPQLQTVFGLVNDVHGVVMIHPRDDFFGLRWRRQDSSELDAALAAYPNVTFLFHSGHPEVFNDRILPLMSKYQNIYYTFDVGHMLVGSWGVSSDRGPESGATERFIANVNKVGIDRIVDENVKRSRQWFQSHPDRILWGTDMGRAWMFEDAPTSMFMEISRRFIGRLPEAVQENYAFRNALRVFGRFLASGSS